MTSKVDMPSINNTISSNDSIHPDEEVTLEKKDEALPSYAYESNSEEADAIPSANATGRDGGNNKKLKNMAFLFGAIVVALLGAGMTINKMQASSKAEEEAKAVEEAHKQKNMSEDSFVLELPAPESALPSDEVVENTEANTLQDGANTSTTLLPEPAPKVEYESTPAVTYSSSQPTPTFNNYNSSTPTPKYEDLVPPEYRGGSTQQQQPMIIDETEESAPVSTPAPIIEKPQPSHVLVDVGSSRTNSENGSNNRNNSSNVFANVSQTSNRDLLLLRGTTIPCTLVTKIDSTYKGFTSCQISKDVYSANGRTLLIERGAKVFGEQNVEITQGKARVSVLWTRIETPKGISINLDSPSTGQLGEMGIGAKVNNHFWQRFGGAIMLSVIQDGLNVASSHLEKKNTSTTNINNTTSTAESMAEEVLKNTINIAPTARINQGTPINIMVAKDVNFEGIYALRR